MDTPTQKPRKLTLKQKKFLKVYFETGNATKAALEAYDTTDSDSARAMGAENLAKLSDVVRGIMMRKGLDPEKLVDTVNAATGANKIHGTNDNFIEIPDHLTRLKAVEIAERWLGLKTDQDSTPPIQNNYIQVINNERKEFE